MATQDQFNSILQRIEQATTQAGALIRKISDDLKAGGMTAQQEDDALSRLDATADALEAMGKTEENPVPLPVPGEGTPSGPTA